MFNTVQERPARAKFDIVMLATVHSAVDDRIFHREAKTLAEAGLSVAIIGRHPRSEHIDGITIEALPGAIPTGNIHRWTRMLQPWAVLRIALRLQGGLYIFHDPELFALGLILRLLGKRVVYDCHENLPMQILQKNWLPVPIRWLLVPFAYATEWLGSRLLTGVILARPAIASRFPKRRTVTVRNFPTRAAINVLLAGPPISKRANVVIYSGGLSPERGIRELVGAFRGMESQTRLLLVGEFDTPEFQQEILASLPSNVAWAGWKPHEEVIPLYNDAKAGAVLLHSTPSHRDSLPVKVFEYLGAGLPIIASNLSEFAEYVEGCGIQVDPHNVEEIRRAVRTIMSDDTALTRMSSVAQERALRLYRWEPEGARLVEFCGRFLRRSRTDT